MASRSPLAILPIRTSSEVVGIGRVIDSSVRQPGGAQVQEIRKKTLRGCSGRRAARALTASFAVQAQLGKLKGRHRAFCRAFRGFSTSPGSATFFWRETAPIPPVEKFA